MQTLIKALLATLLVGFMGGAYAAGDTSKCDKLMGAEKEKCLADAKK